MATKNYTEGTDSVQWKIIESIEKNTNILQLDVPFSDSIDVGDTVNLFDKNSVKIFQGLVQEVKIAGVKSVEVYDFGAQLLQRTVNKIYESQSPEQIIQDVLSTYTDLTYVSTISSGVTIEIYPAKDKRAWDIVTEMADSLLATIDIDENKNFNLVLKGETFSDKVINNTVASIDGNWKKDKSQLVNSLIVKGDKQVIEKNELFSGDGSTTEFTLAEIPISVKVSVGGVEQTIYVEGQSSGDVRVSKETKKIIFDTAPASGTDNISIDYTFEIPIKIRRRIKSSIDTYGQHDHIIEEKYIKTRDEAAAIALTYLDKFSEPLLSSKWIMTSTAEVEDFKNYIPGQIIDVDDTNFGVSGEFLIIKTERDSNGKFVVYVGEQPENFVEYNKEVVKRIKQLEEKDDNSDFLNEDEYLPEQANITFEISIENAFKRTYDSDTWYWQEVGGTRNDWREDGTGDIFREEGGFTDEALFVTYLITESEDRLTTEGGDNLILEY